eukprot:3880612-Pyramimonas_sp.AAC.2
MMLQLQRRPRTHMYTTPAHRGGATSILLPPFLLFFFLLLLLLLSSSSSSSPDPSARGAWGLDRDSGGLGPGPPPATLSARRAAGKHPWAK